MRLAAIVCSPLLLVPRPTARALWGACLAMIAGGVFAADGVTIQLAVDGSVLEGTPIAWNDAEVLLLARNGFLVQFPPSQAEGFRQLATQFRPCSQGEMRSQLQREFGRRFDVSGTGNYLVVHPAGQKDRWAQRFESLYRSFVRYFSVRGMQPGALQFPLVAVVLHSQEEFLEHSRRAGGSVSMGVLGYYSPRSNQVLLFDVTRGNAADDSWYINAETILHEATHQMAFNSGLHSRWAPPPRWVGEGLAMLFEAPGVWDAQRHPHLNDRINTARLRAFRQFGERRARGFLPHFVSQSDSAFFRTPAAAYAEAWAFSFFLSEMEPAKYLSYLQRTAQREPLKRYTAAEQLAEFTDVFGQDLGMLEARYLRFISQLP